MKALGSDVAPQPQRPRVHSHQNKREAALLPLKLCHPPPVPMHSARGERASPSGWSSSENIMACVSGNKQVVRNASANRRGRRPPATPNRIAVVLMLSFVTNRSNNAKRHAVVMPHISSRPKESTQIAMLSNHTQKKTTKKKKGERLYRRLAHPSVPQPRRVTRLLQLGEPQVSQPRFLPLRFHM